MNIFKDFENELSYKDSLQLDSAFSAAHINYDKSPVFNEIESKYMAENSRMNSITSEDKIEDVRGVLLTEQKKILKRMIEYYYGKNTG